MQDFVHVGSYFKRLFVCRGESIFLVLILLRAPRAHMHICISCTCTCAYHAHSQKWSELHRLARLQIYPRSSGVPGVRDQLGRTAGSISQKGLPTVSRWRHGRQWSYSSITNQNSWNRLRIVQTHRAMQSDCLCSQHTHHSDKYYLIFKFDLILSVYLFFINIDAIITKMKDEWTVSHIFAQIAKWQLIYTVNPQNLGVHHSRNTNICDAFNDRYTRLAFINCIFLFRDRFDSRKSIAPRCRRSIIKNH